MFNIPTTKQSHFYSACSRFVDAHSLPEVASAAGIPPQMLRNKLNPDQPHQLTVRDLAAIYHATGDDTLYRGLLLDCGLTAVAISPAHDSAPLTLRVIDTTAKVAGASAQAVHVLESGRVSRRQRNALVGALMAAVGELLLLATEVENRCQTTPCQPCAATVARRAVGA